MTPLARRCASFVCAAAAAALTAACNRGPAAQSSPQPDTVRAFVSILPQAYFVKRVGGARVTVDVLIGRGQTEHSYEPTPRQMLALADAHVYFAIGVSAERSFLEKAASTHRSLRIVRTQQGIPLRKMTPAESCSDPDHEHGDHDHDGDDPHIWLDPRLVKIQAQTICHALSDIDPAHAAEYASNLERFHADLDAIDARIAAMLEPLRGRELFVFHPSYGYFCDRYGLVQVAVEQEGKDPSLKQLAALTDRARVAGVPAVFYQPQFSRQPAEVIARAIGGVAVALDPLSDDYLSNLDAMATTIRDAFLGGGGSSPDAESD